MSFNEISSQLHHDINCISVDGADRFKRRQALKLLQLKLAKFGLLNSSSEISPEFRDSVILDLLAKPLAWSLKDSAESCRVEALNLLRELTPVDTNRLLADILPVVLERMDPSVEKSEEFRLSLVQYLQNLLSKPISSSELVKHHAFVVKIALKAISDPFPDLKLAGCSLIGSMTSHLTEACDFDVLISSLLRNLKHQRQKIRSESLRILFALVHISMLYCHAQPLPKWFGSDLLPALSNITSDRSSHVRNLLFDEVANLISSVNLPTGPIMNALLLIILGGLSDESDDVRSNVEHRILNIRRPIDGLSEQSDFKGLICSNLSDVLRTHLLPMISAWTSALRLNASKMLQTLITIVCERITSYADKVVPCLINALGDDHHLNVESLCRCAYLLGLHSDIDVVLQIVYSILAVSASNLNEDKLVWCFNFLCFYLQGIAATSLSSSSDFLLKILSIDNVFASKNIHLASKSLQFLGTCVECVPNACQSYEFAFFGALLQVISSHPGLESSEAVLEQFRSLLKLESTADLCARHFSSFMGTVQCSDIMSCNADPLLCLVEHTASSMSYDNSLSVVTLIKKFFSCLDERADRSDADNAMVKLTSLLPAIARMFQFTPGIEVFIDPLMTDVFSRCLTWHVGKSAAGLRLEALRCLMIGTQSESLIESCSSSSLDQVFPQIVSCLDDFSLDIREHALDLVQALLQKPKIALSIPLSLNQELLGRLDDSSDQVRIKTCSVLKDLYSRHRSEDEANALLKDIVSAAFIHLDDTNSDIEVAVFQLLCHLRDNDSTGRFSEVLQSLDVKLMASPYVEKLLHK